MKRPHPACSIRLIKGCPEENGQSGFVLISIPGLIRIIFPSLSEERYE